MTGHADGKPDADPLTKASSNRKDTVLNSQRMHAESTQQTDSD